MQYKKVRDQLMLIRFLMGGGIFTCDDILMPQLKYNARYNAWRQVTPSQWEKDFYYIIKELVSPVPQEVCIPNYLQRAKDMLINQIYFERLCANPRAAWFTLIYICKNCIVDNEIARKKFLSQELGSEWFDKSDESDISNESTLDPVSVDKSICNSLMANDSISPDNFLFSFEMKPRKLSRLGGSNNFDCLDTAFSYCDCFFRPYNAINTSPLTHHDLIEEIMCYIDDAPVTRSRKIYYMGTLISTWQRNYNDYLTDFDWIDPKDDFQVKYLWSYLKHGGGIPSFLKPIDEEMRYNMLIACLDNWSPFSKNVKKALIDKMSHAWSQKKSSMEKAKSK